MHSIEFNYAPASFTNVWIKNAANQGERPLRNAADFALPQSRTELSKKSPLCSLQCECNSMDEKNMYIQNHT